MNSDLDNILEDLTEKSSAQDSGFIQEKSLKNKSSSMPNMRMERLAGVAHSGYGNARKKRVLLPEYLQRAQQDM